MQEETSRREFNKALLAYVLDLGSSMWGCSIGGRTPTLDISETLKQPVTKVANRGFPLTNVGRLKDWLGHRNSPNYRGRAGVDYAPIGDRTEIVPVASGVVVGSWDDHNIGGNGLAVHHGLGYYSLYHHLQKKRYVKERDIVHRNTVMALMGDTGAIRITHLHLDVYGPFYTNHLKFDHIQYHPLEDSVSPWVLDAEEFSILGKHKPLPFQLPEDLELDKRFSAYVIEIRNTVNEFLRLFPNIRKNRYYDNPEVTKYQDVTDMYLGRDIAEIYNGVLKEVPSIPKSDASNIGRALEDIMKETTPRLTAPIKDGQTPQYYTYLR